MRPDLKKIIKRREYVINRINEFLISALQLNLSTEELDPDAPLFATGLGLDSIDAVVIIVEVEAKFGISISEDEGKLALRTINSLADMVLSKEKNESKNRI